jgi:hypothetical protein
MTLSDIIQIIIAVLSLIATIAVSLSIYWLQMRHEREIEQIEAKRMQQDIEEKAHVFLSENNEERDYLPWCAVASNVCRHDKHTRQIYTNFCRCPAELQSEILRQSGLDIKLPVDINWVSQCLESLKNDIAKHKLGRDYLYDGAKYFHRGYERYRDQEWEDLRQRRDLNPIAVRSSFFGGKNSSLLDYIDEYFMFLYSEHRPVLYNKTPKPPLDYMWENYRLGEADEEEVCRWIMEAISDIAIICHNRENGIGGIHNLTTDAIVETFEDKYFEALLWLFYTYYFNEKPQKEKKKKRIKKKPNKNRK